MQNPIKAMTSRNPKALRRMTLDVQQNFADMLDTLAEKQGISKAEALRRATIVYNRLYNETEGHADRRFAISENGAIVREFILP